MTRQLDCAQVEPAALVFFVGRVISAAVAFAGWCVRSQGTATIRLTLTAKGRRLLTGAKRIRLAASGIFTPKGGTMVHAARTLVLRR